MRRPVCLLPLVLVLAACGASPSDDGAPPPAPSSGSGEGDVVVSTNEPFWQARVEGDTIELTGVDAAPRRLHDARTSMTADGRRISARDADGEVVVIVRRMRCDDDMSGARFPMTGLLTIDGRGPFRGCARPASMPAPVPPEEGGTAPVAPEGTVLLPDVFLGRWNANADACAGTAGDMGLTVLPDRLRFHESDAVVTEVRPRDDGDVDVSLTHDGEGAPPWNSERRLRLSEGGARLRVEDAEGAGADRVRCAD